MKSFFSLKMPRIFEQPLAEGKKILAAKDIGAIVASPYMTLVLLCLMLTPLALLGGYYYHKYCELVHLEERIDALELKAKKTLLARTRAAAFIKQLQEADPHSIKNTLNAMTLLQKEQHYLKFLCGTEILKWSPSLAERRAVLIHKNHIEFYEISKKEMQGLEETLYGLRNPVQLDGEDVNNLLERVERFPEKKPQSMLQSFTLNTKHLSKEYHVFECDFKLLQRTLKES